MKKILLISTLLLSFGFSREMPLQEMTEQCFAGKANSCTNTAINYYAKKDYKSAYNLFEKGCELKDDRSCYQKAKMEYHGIGDTKKEEVKSLKAITELCEKNNEFKSCLFLGRKAFNNGEKDKAKKYYKKVCDFGIPSACKTLKEIK